jgi:hypothetical protein
VPVAAAASAPAYCRPCRLAHREVPAAACNPHDLRRGWTTLHILVKGTRTKPTTAAADHGVHPSHALNRTARDRQCPACKSGAVSLTHVLYHCTAAPVVAARADVERTAGRATIAIARAALRAQHRISTEEAQRGNFELNAALSARLQRLVATVHATDWTSHDGRFVIYRLFALSPWPTRALDETPDDVPAPLIREMALIFESKMARNHRLRPLANTWVSWAGAHLANIRQAWASAVDNALTHTA